MAYTGPTCKKCTERTTVLAGLEDHEETVRRADRGELKGFCPYHDWQEISLAEQQALAAVARRKLETSS